MNLKYIDPSRWWRSAKFELLEPLNYSQHTVPAGFITDGASVPRWLPLLGVVLLLLGHVCWYCYPLGGLLVLSLALFPRFGKSFKAAILHDYLLKVGDNWRDANKHFYVQMQLDGVQLWRANIMYIGVTVWQFIKRVVFAKGDQTASGIRFQHELLMLVVGYRKRYRYKSDGVGRDKWHVLKAGTLVNPARGDCEDAALGMMAQYFGGTLKMLWAYFKDDCALHYCTINGNGHAVGEISGHYFDCNRNGIFTTIADFSDPKNTYQAKYRFGLFEVVRRLLGRTKFILLAAALAGVGGFVLFVYANNFLIGGQ